MKSVSWTSYSKLRQIYTDVNYGNKNSAIIGGGNDKIKLNLEKDREITLTKREIYDILISVRKKFNECKN